MFARNDRWLHGQLAPDLFAPILCNRWFSRRIPRTGVSRNLFRKSEDRRNLGGSLRDAFDALDIGGDSAFDFTIEDVDVQWSAYRPSGRKKEIEAEVSERDEFDGRSRTRAGLMIGRCPAAANNSCVAACLLCSHLSKERVASCRTRLQPGQPCLVYEQIHM